MPLVIDCTALYTLLELPSIPSAKPSGIQRPISAITLEGDAILSALLILPAILLAIELAFENSDPLFASRPRLNPAIDSLPIVLNVDFIPRILDVILFAIFLTADTAPLDFPSIPCLVPNGIFSAKRLYSRDGDFISLYFV